MDKVEVVKAYFEALDAGNYQEAEKYLDEQYQMIDFTKEPMGKTQWMELVRLLKTALPNLTHSLYNIHAEGNLVKVTVQRSGTNSGILDLRAMGIGIVPRSQKFIIFPNGNLEFTVEDDKIITERDVSPASPNRRWSGMLRAFGVNLTSL